MSWGVGTPDIVSCYSFDVVDSTTVKKMVLILQSGGLLLGSCRLGFY